MKLKTKPINIFAEIRRVNEEERTIDAYAFVNEVVEGEGGVRLKRTAMEAATPDYMAWANVRRMHQPDAIGVARSVDWDGTGAAMVVEVVDDDAWDKVKRGVYKGLSVAVAATVMRGKDVEACRWYETSLVDRPKDPDAKILAFRAEGVSDAPDQEFETEVEDAAPQERSEGPAADELPVLARISLPAEWTEQQVTEFRAQWDETKARDYRGTLERAEKSEAELVRVQAALSEKETALAAAVERVSVLEKSPVPVTTPVRYPEALERTMAANQARDADQAQAVTLAAEYKRLSEELPKETDEGKRREGVQRMLYIRRELANQGVTL